MNRALPRDSCGSVPDVGSVALRWSYSLLVYLLAPLAMVRLLRRSRYVPEYRTRWRERLGLFPALERRPRIWIHAVSVGEVVAASSLISELRRRYHAHAVLVTTTTPSGSQMVQRLFAGGVEHLYLPWDLPGAVSRFLDQAKPNLCVLMETELWPNLIVHCHQRGIPVAVVNGRLSQRSVDAYRRLGGLFRPMISRMSLIVAQSREDAGRFLLLGAQERAVHVVGNLKFDVSAAKEALVRARELRQEAGLGRFIWTAGSTHPGEEALVVEAFRSFRWQVPDALLILVPRHPERTGEVAALCEERGFTVTRLALARRVGPATAVLLGDTVGELPSAYAAADATFVGGSLVPAGGHNPLEPAELGVPVTVGPHTLNFASIYARLREIGAVEVVDGPAQLAQAMLRIKRNPQEARRRGRLARDFVNSNRGTARRVAELMGSLIQAGPPPTSSVRSRWSRELA